jgi:hypothetical protein
VIPAIASAEEILDMRQRWGAVVMGAMRFQVPTRHEAAKAVANDWEES